MMVGLRPLINLGLSHRFLSKNDIEVHQLDALGDLANVKSL